LATNSRWFCPPNWVPAELVNIRAVFNSLGSGDSRQVALKSAADSPDAGAAGGAAGRANAGLARPHA